MCTCDLLDMYDLTLWQISEIPCAYVTTLHIYGSLHGKKTWHKQSKKLTNTIKKIVYSNLYN